MAAKIVGTNRQYISDAEKIEKHAPELLKPILDGKINIQDAKKVAKMELGARQKVMNVVNPESKDFKKKNVKEAINEVKKEERQIEIRSEIEKLKENKDENIKMFVADINTVSNSEISDKTANLIFTDPPYHDEYLQLYEKLGLFASKVLKDDGVLITYAGKMYLPEVMNLLSKFDFNYIWCMAVFHPFSKSKINKLKIFENWRPILIFSKTKQPNNEWVQDVVRGNRDKEFHAWQQDVESAVNYISAYSKPGDMVIDPFMGGGTTAEACLKTGRRFIGFDVCEDSVNASKIRIFEKNNKITIKSTERDY